MYQTYLMSKFLWGKMLFYVIVNVNCYSYETLKIKKKIHYYYDWDYSCHNYPHFLFFIIKSHFGQILQSAVDTPDYKVIFCGIWAVV